MTALARAAAVALRRYGATLRDALWDADEARREAVTALEALEALEALRDALPAGDDDGPRPYAIAQAGLLGGPAWMHPSDAEIDRWATAWDAWAEAAS